MCVYVCVNVHKCMYLCVHSRDLFNIHPDTCRKFSVSSKIDESVVVLQYQTAIENQLEPYPVTWEEY